MDNEDELKALDISIEAILISISFAVLHAIIEIIFLNLEKQANKTTMMHYLIISFNGRFGYIPYIHLFASNKSSEE